ncbi:type II secretion system protein [bacterium]|nr:type II secretion system protein [bacterium]
MITRKRKKLSGFTLIEIMIVIAIVGVLTTMSLPNMLKARAEAKLTVCVQNLKTIAAAVEMCKTRHPELLMGHNNADLHFIIDEECCLVQLGYLKSIPKCPNGGEYSYKFSKATHGQAYPGYWHVCHETKDHHKDAGLDSWFPYYRSDIGICLYDRTH